MSDASTGVKKKVRYAVVGTGGRVPMFLNPLVQKYQQDGELVGLCDVNPGRVEFYNQKLENELGYHRVPGYTADKFDQMIQETRPDVVIVTTVDAVHDQYIIRAMELGCDAITEKPMTIDDEKCRAILDAVKRTGRKLRVTFNYRWGPGPSLVRKLLADGTIGEIIHADMEYLLNTSHGADYFRRWHREKDKSGGLMVHKSTHHFDLVNWWLDAVPESVFGFGRLAFYGRENAQKRGIEVKYDRYTGNDTANDPFAFKLDTDERTKALYLEPEKYDGYKRDRNVFGDNITIEDTMSVLVKYRTGAVLNYSLNAYLPREGFHIAFNGTKGRIEYTEAHASHIIAGQDDKELANEMKWESQIIVHPMFGKAYSVPIPKAEGGHGGGDPLIQEQIFSANPPEEKLGRNAGHGQGAASILIGIAANKSFVSGQPVRISELCPQLGDATHLHELV
jgi:predicted dehydrogenase